MFRTVIARGFGVVWFAPSTTGRMPVGPVAGETPATPIKGEEPVGLARLSTFAYKKAGFPGKRGVGLHYTSVS